MFTNIKPHVLAIVVGFIFLIALSGCSSTSSFFSRSVDLESPITVPSKYIYFPTTSSDTLAKEQTALTNMLVALQGSSNDSSEKSQIFYAIGTLYDELGLEALARFMYTNAIIQDPTFYRPYQVLGPYFYRDGKLGDAVDFLDAALELNKEKDDPYTYLHRGIIMYYTNHDEFALQDIVSFYDNDKVDPYRILTLYPVVQRIHGKKEADTLLSAWYENALKTKAKDNWGFNFVKLYLNKLSVDGLFDDILKIRYDDDLFQEHLCEAYYYVGRYMLNQGNEKLAYDYFKLAKSTKKYSFLEYRLAGYEIDSLEKKYNIKRFVTPDDISE